MHALALPCDEARFAAFVDACRGDASQRDALLDLLPEEHPAYADRGTAATMRMRGWLLLAVSPPLDDTVLAHVVEQFDSGMEPYLVAVAAHVLRRDGMPHPAHAPLLVRALSLVRHRDDRVDLDRYGAGAVGAGGTTAVRELLATLEWMGDALAGVAGDLRALANENGWRADDRATLLRLAGQADAATPADDCCGLPWPFARALRAEARPDAAAVERVAFEDQDGRAVDYATFFRGKPSVVAFFYTRCENPRKCSLTVAKLAAVRRELDARGLGGRVRVAAITYDPGYDSPTRLRGYGDARRFTFDDDTRLLRAVSGMDDLRAALGLGVNFVASLVNRHRIELHVLDAQGHVAATYARLGWDEADVVATAQALAEAPARRAAPAGLAVIGSAASVVAAFFPKCPMCWAAYLSLFGIASLERLPYSPWLQPLFVGLMLVNLASLWLRARAAGTYVGFGLAAAGALVVGGLVLGLGWSGAAPAGIALTLVGSLLGVFRKPRKARSA